MTTKEKTPEAIPVSMPEQELERARIAGSLVSWRRRVLDISREVIPVSMPEQELERARFAGSFVSWRRPVSGISGEDVIIEIGRQIGGSTADVLAAMGHYHRDELKHAEAQTRQLSDRLSELEKSNKALERMLERISEQNRELRHELLLAHPLVRWLRLSLAAVAIFAFSLLAWLWKGILIISPIVSLVGAVLSIGFVVMMLLFQKDWRNMTEKDSQ